MYFLCPSDWFNHKECSTKWIEDELNCLNECICASENVLHEDRAEMFHTCFEENAVSKEITSVKNFFFHFGSYYLHTSTFKVYSTCKFLHWYTGSTFDWVKYSFFPCFTSLSWQQPIFSLVIFCFTSTSGAVTGEGKKPLPLFDLQWPTCTLCAINQAFIFL